MTRSPPFCPEDGPAFNCPCFIMSTAIWALAVSTPRSAPSLPALATSQHPSPRYLPWSVAVGSRRLGARALRAARATTRRAPRALRAKTPRCAACPLACLLPCRAVNAHLGLDMLFLAWVPRKTAATKNENERERERESMRETWAI